MSEDFMGLRSQVVEQQELGEEVREVITEIVASFNQEELIAQLPGGEGSHLSDGQLIDPQSAQHLYNYFEDYFRPDAISPTESEIQKVQGAIPDMSDRPIEVERANACMIHPSDSNEEDDEHRLGIESGSVNLIVTSPPYWQLRDYGVDNQLGQETKPEQYIENLVSALDRWEEFLHPEGSVFLNIGDKYKNKSLVGIPGRFAKAARDRGWIIRNHIIWAKENGIPSPAKDRLVPRHEHIYHLVRDDEYYYDLFGYSQVFGNGSNPGDVWRMSHDRNTGDHLAPFPRELVQRAVTLACPPAICPECGELHTRQIERPLTNLNPDRPQARRALEKYENSSLTKEHLKAIRAVGISDAGKAKQIQDGAGNNDQEIQEKADEAKEVLGGYFREFTFPQPTTVGWSGCECDVDAVPGMVFDPFAGSGTTLNTAYSLGYQAWGTDLDQSNFQRDITSYSD
jgi:DNA modification methylase